MQISEFLFVKIKCKYKISNGAGINEMVVAINFTTNEVFLYLSTFHNVLVKFENNNQKFYNLGFPSD